MILELNHHGLYLHVEGSVDNMQAHCKVDSIVFRSALAQPRVSGGTQDLRHSFFLYGPTSWLANIISLNIPKIHFEHGKCCLPIVKLVEKTMLA